MKLEKAMAYGAALPVVWVNGQACTGCTVSLANSVYYMTIQELLLTNGQDSRLALKYNETLMAATGLEATNQDFGTLYALAIEGSIPTANDGLYCQVGDWSNSGAAGETCKDVIDALAPGAAAVVTMGTCAAFGGIPGANGNVTQARGFLNYWAWKLGNGSPTTGAATADYKSMRAKTVNVPGCPPNPNWMVGTLAYIMAQSDFTVPTVKLPSLDALRRPRLYFGERNCNYCDRFTPSLGTDGFVGVNADLTYNRLSVNEPQRIGDPAENYPSGKCLKLAGCKGSRTKSDCAVRKWHSDGFMRAGINWCVGAGAPCQGCTQNFFPDRMSPFQYIR
jgi:hydrogenase small subunit